MQSVIRAAWLAAAVSTAFIIACGDSNPSSPDGTRTNGGVARSIDTVTTGPTATNDTSSTHPDTVKAPPDSGGQTKGSSDPRKLIGVVKAIGAQPDTSQYANVRSATIILSAPEDSTTGAGGQELARATSAADGTFSLGSFKPGVYMITVTPPTGSSYTGTHWAFLITQYSAPTMSLGVWLGRK